MIEACSFVAVFTVQIVFFSMLAPLLLIGPLRGQIGKFIAERKPPIDPSAVARLDHRLRLLRMLSWGIAAIGLLLLVVMIRYLQRPDWTDGPLEAAVPVYFIIQVVPTVLAYATTGGFHEVLRHSLPPEKRRALLQPRGLFDFVSRPAVAIAVLVYFLFLAFLLYIDRHPFPGFGGVLANTAGVTFVYVAMAFAIYMTLRTMGSSRLQAHEYRIRSVGLAVRISVYTCIVTVASMAATMTLTLLDQQRWEPTFVSITVIVVGLLSGVALKEQMRIPEGAGPADAALTR